MEQISDFVTYNKRKIVVVIVIIIASIIIYTNIIEPYLDRKEMPDIHYIRADKVESVLKNIGVPTDNITFVEYEKNSLVS